MASVIKAGNATDGVQVTSDNTGILELKTGTGAGTTAVTIGTNQAVTFAGAVTLSGNQTVTGNLTVDGNTTLGNANTDTILMTAAPSIGGAGLGMGFGFRNRIINGAMVIDQRNAGASVTPANFAYLTDRWQFRASQSSKFTAEQTISGVAAPTGFTDYLGMTSTSAYSVGSGEQFGVRQFIEGFNISDLGWGTASAATVTLSFWVRSSLTGTHSGALGNSGDGRAYPFSFTVSSANTWEYKTINIAGDTSGTWLTNNGIGIKVSFNLGAGSTMLATAGAWTTGEIVGATGSVSVVGTNGATFYITGVQLEKGSTATSFDYRPYGTELQLCQRYYEKNFPQTTAPQQGMSTSGQVYSGGLNAYATTAARTPRIRFAVTKRASPTITFFRSAAAQGGTVDGLWSWYTAGGAWVSSTGTIVIDGTTQDNEFGVEMSSSGAFTVTASYLFGGTWTASAEL